MQPGGHAREDRASLGAGYVADGDDIGEDFAGFHDVPDCPGGIAGNVNADLLHGLNDNGVEPARLEPGAFDLKRAGAALFQKRLGHHLAAGAVVGMQINRTFFSLRYKSSAAFFVASAAGGFLPPGPRLVFIGSKAAFLDVTMRGRFYHSARQAVCCIRATQGDFRWRNLHGLQGKLADVTGFMLDVHVEVFREAEQRAG